MSNYRRARFPGGLYFFTVITHRRRPVLTDPRMRAALRDAITQTRAGLPFEIVAWVCCRITCTRSGVCLKETPTPENAGR